MNPRAARQASGMTRNEWAMAMGVSVLTTKRWEAPAADTPAPQRSTASSAWSACLPGVGSI